MEKKACCKRGLRHAELRKWRKKHVTKENFGMQNQKSKKGSMLQGRILISEIMETNKELLIRMKEVVGRIYLLIFSLERNEGIAPSSNPDFATPFAFL